MRILALRQTAHAPLFIPANNTEFMVLGPVEVTAVDVLPGTLNDLHAGTAEIDPDDIFSDEDLASW